MTTTNRKNSETDDNLFQFLSEENKKNLVNPLGFYPLLDGQVEFINLGIKSRKNADFVFHLNPDNYDLSVASISNARTIEYFRDPDTGFFVITMPEDKNNKHLNRKTNDNESLHKRPVDYFAHSVIKILKRSWQEKYNQLKRICDNDPDRYSATYKDLTAIDHQITEKLNSRYDIRTRIISELRSMTYRGPLHINEVLAFKDTVLTKDSCVTERLDYNDPHQCEGSSQAQREEILDFLRVFMDDENIKIFLWFMGAVLDNGDAGDVAKMLIVSSAKGGNGKNTLIEAILRALLKGFYDVKDSLDDFFSKKNKFLASSLIPLHVTVFSEADWSDSENSDHDLSGFNINKLKTMISDGRFTSEAKFEKAETKIATHTFYITLTNHFPRVSPDDEALNRRFLPLALKSSSMIEKGHKLGLNNKQKLFNYVYEHRQDFADVCYDYYNHNRSEFLQSEYNQTEAIKSIRQQDLAYAKQRKEQQKSFDDLKAIDPVKALKTLSKQSGIDFNKLASLISSTNLSDATKSDFKFGNIFRAEKVNGKYVIYVDASKKIMTEITGQETAKKVFTNAFGKPVKKFDRRMFKL